jgi:type VI secretion system lysozyme-like protein
VATEPKQPKPIPGARTPLFERLVDYQSHEPSQADLRVQNRQQLRESVRRELYRLLNTRCPTRADRNGTVIDYGIPDFSWMSSSSGDDRQQLAEIIARKVAAFEPRLAHVRVMFDEEQTDPRAVEGTISAVLIVEAIREPVSFPLLIHNKSGVAELAAPASPHKPSDS